jgi:resuscitation-promoting factor RpfB
VLRSVKYGLNGAVIAGLVAIPVLWNTVDKSVDLVVDGRPHQVQTTALTVGQVVAAEGYRVTSHDLLAPAAASHIDDGTRIVLRRGRLLHLDVDGVRTDVWTTAPTVAQALAELGYSSSDFVSVSRSRRLPLGATQIAIRSPRVITVGHDGKRDQVTTTEATVGGVLDDLGITLDDNDRLSVAESSPVKAGEVVTVQRVTRKIVTRIELLPFKVTKRSDPTLRQGVTKIIRPGKKGRTRDTYAVVYIDGKIAGRTLLDSQVLSRPRNQVEKVGTLIAPTAAPASPGTAKAIAHELIGTYGWDDSQYDCLVVLWDNESSWNVHAANPSTGAYGIPQALPGSKMATAGPDWENSATTQIKWGLGYINERYGSPCNAWSYWQSNGWY